VIVSKVARFVSLKGLLPFINVLSDQEEELVLCEMRKTWDVWHQIGPKNILFTEQQWVCKGLTWKTIGKSNLYFKRR